MFGLNMIANDIIITAPQNDYIFVTEGPLHIQKTNYYYKGPS